MNINGVGRRLRIVLACAAAASAMTLVSGCFLVAVGAAGAAGAGTVAYVDGKLTATLAKPYEAVVAASGRAIAELQFLKVGETKDALKDTVEVRTADDKKVTIEATRVGDNLTRVEIRVGMFGDQPVSRTILDRINAGL
jgi:acetaldehyde dehydrogenase (acetylating)